MNQQPQQIQIQANDSELRGNYSNFLQIFHAKEEFVLDFFLVTPPKGLLNSRIIMSPGHVKRVFLALRDNIEKYESQFGKIEEAKELEKGIGFAG